MNKATNVSAGKPKIGGAIFRAPLGTPLPTNALDELDESVWQGIGYCSDDGLTNSNTRTSEDIKAWGGDKVLSIQTEKTDTFKMTMIETMNIEVLKMVYGDDNVSGSLEEGISVKANSEELEAASYVIDLALRDKAIKRIVIPNAKISEVGDTVYSDSDAVGFETTLSCMPGDDGDTHKEYIIRKGTTPVEPITSPKVTAVAQSASLFETPVSDIQGDDIVITDNAITGTLHYLDSGAIADHWGAGNFIALQFSDIDEKATSVKVGLNPSESSGLVEIIDDPDKNGVFKITNKDTQVFRVVTTDGTNTKTVDYDLSGLTVENS